MRVAVARDLGDARQNWTQIAVGLQRAVGLVAQRESHLDPFRQLGLGILQLRRLLADFRFRGFASQRLLAPERDFLLNAVEHLVLAWPRQAIDLIRGDAQDRIGQRSGDLDTRSCRVGIQCASSKLRTEFPGNRQHAVQCRARLRIRCRRTRLFSVDPGCVAEHKESRERESEDYPAIWPGPATRTLRNAS